MAPVETQPPAKRRLDSLDHVELVLALEELSMKKGCTPKDVEGMAEEIRRRFDLPHEQFEELRNSLTEATRKRPPDRRFILDERPTSKWALMAFWLLMIGLAIVLWQMASGAR